MSKPASIVIFVHGWSVTNTETYGGLPIRLRNEASTAQLDISIEHIFLGRYLSFHDDVTLRDVSRGFDAALGELLARPTYQQASVTCITHSTGGPVIRDWWQHFYQRQSRRCPMTHLIMLAPANHGSALAQLGKSRLGRIKAAFSGVEPGQRILDWLELGSDDASRLNSDWIKYGGSALRKSGMFPFVLTGQTIDRKLYDHLNAYTGESGSDGVVRVAAANMNTTRMSLVQEPATTNIQRRSFAPLELESIEQAPQTAMRIIAGASHSGTDHGIMRSVYRPAGHARGRDVTNCILRCLAVRDKRDYDALVQDFERESRAVQRDEQLEIERKLLRRDAAFIHDRYSMVIFRVFDDHDNPVNDFDLILTAGRHNDPDHLPRGFFMDRQQNRRAANAITYYFNYDVMSGTDAVFDADGVKRREALPGARSLGLQIHPRPDTGFVRYQPCQIKADATMLQHALTPNATTMIDIRLRRLVDKNVFRIRKIRNNSVDYDFRKTRPGDDVVD